MILDVNLSHFFGYIMDAIFDVIGDYVILLKSVTLVDTAFNGNAIHITAFNLRIGVLFLQIFFGIVFILAPRLGGGSVMKGNGV